LPISADTLFDTDDLIVGLDKKTLAAYAAKNNDREAFLLAAGRGWEVTA